MVSSVQFTDGHHVADLGILVGLGTKEGLSVNHGDGVGTSRLETLQISKIRSGVDKSSSDGIGVSGNRSDNADAGTLGTGHVVQQQVDQQKVSQVVDTHGHFETIVGPGGFGIGGSVDGSVTDQMGQGSGALEGLEVGHKVADGLETCEFELHHRVRVLGQSNFLGDSLCLFNITTGHDNVVFSGLGKGNGGSQTQSRGGSGDDDQLLESNLDPTQDLGGFLGVGLVDF
mmetsp:Transcript_17029/g.42548  ORF Transcript_17029/g.42548 Transcript_17029/m.42548 type:complete len:229 (-) Transcript_17029:377-1063(-)